MSPMQRKSKEKDLCPQRNIKEISTKKPRKNVIYIYIHTYTHTYIHIYAYIYIYIDIYVYTLLEVWTGCVYIYMCLLCLWMHKQNASTQYCCKKVAAACPSRMAPLRAACDFLGREAGPLCLTALVLAWVIAR